MCFSAVYRLRWYLMAFRHRH